MANAFQLIYALQSMKLYAYDKINGFQVFRDGQDAWEVCGNNGQSEVLTLTATILKLGA